MKSKDIVDLNDWNRKIINNYWLFALLVVFTELIVSLTGTVADDEQFPGKTLIVSVLFLTVLLIDEVIFRLKCPICQYLIVLSATVMVTILVNVYTDMRSLTVIYILPILVSVSYYKNMAIFVTSVANVISYLSTYVLNYKFHQNVRGLDIFIMISVFLIGGHITSLIMSRGVKLYSDLQKTEETSRDLLVKNATMDMMIKIDSLTKLYNHQTFHDYLDRLVKQCCLNGFEVQLAIIDIDDFKMVNDTYGHRAGDAVLRRVADVIRKSIDSNDFASRYGGEEFAIIFTDKKLESAYEVLEKIRNEVAGLYHFEIGGKAVTVSIGLKTYSSNGKENLFKGADAALYEAKKGGKNRISIAT